MVKTVEGGEVVGSDRPEGGRDAGATGGGIDVRGIVRCGSRADKLQGRRERGKGEHVHRRSWAPAKRRVVPDVGDALFES